MNARSVVTNSDWKLSDIPEPSGPSYVTTFACGGGSSMGYRLAGWRAVGFAEVDKRMAALYRRNLGAGDDWIGDIRDLVTEPKNIPRSWYGVDVLDGSPPCTVFSEARTQGKAGAKRKYAEGATTQRLDDLFFWFLDLAAIIKPTVFVAENVMGLSYPKNRGYFLSILQKAKEAGYATRVYALNAASHGAPQLRRRLFFVGSKDASRVLSFHKRPKVTVGEACEGAGSLRGGLGKIRPRLAKEHANTAPGRPVKGGAFANVRINKNDICIALGAHRTQCPLHWSEPRFLSYDECARLQTFPDDYDFGDQCGQYVCGMSVPPFLARDVALAITGAYFGGTDGR